MAEGEFEGRGNGGPEQNCCQTENIGFVLVGHLKRNLIEKHLKFFSKLACDACETGGSLLEDLQSAIGAEVSMNNPGCS
jgi:hypothetical protein